MALLDPREIDAACGCALSAPIPLGHGGRQNLVIGPAHQGQRALGTCEHAYAAAGATECVHDCLFPHLQRFKLARILAQPTALAQLRVHGIDEGRASYRVGNT